MSKPIGISRLHHLCLSALFVVLWSSGFVGVKLATDVAPALTMLMWRSLALTVLLLPWLTVALRTFSATELRRQALIGLLSQAVYLVAVFYAIGEGVSSGTTALMDGIQPLVVAVLAGPVLGTVVAPRQWWGLGLGLAGVVLVCLGDLASPASTAAGWVYAIPLVGMAGLVAATFVSRRAQERVPKLPALAVHCTVTAAAVSALAAGTGQAVPPLGLDFWLAIAWIALLATLGGYGLYWLLLEQRGVTQVNTLLFLVPPVTVAWGAVWFGEPVGALTVLGLGTALLAVHLARQAPTRAPEALATSPAAASVG